MPTLEQLLQRIATLEQQMQLLKAASTIPYEIDQAFRKRLVLSPTGVAVTANSATGHSQTVQESGSATYGVLKNPDKYLSVTVAGTTYYFPAFAT